MGCLGVQYHRTTTHSLLRTVCPSLRIVGRNWRQLAPSASWPRHKLDLGQEVQIPFDILAGDGLAHVVLFSLSEISSTR